MLWRLDDARNRGKLAARRRKPITATGYTGIFLEAFQQGYRDRQEAEVKGFPLAKDYAAGLDAFYAGEPITANPHNVKEEERRYGVWVAGWKKGKNKETLQNLPLLVIQNGICYLCGKPMLTNKETSYDHVVPKSREGKDEGNLLLAHRNPCNTVKSNRMPYACELMYLDFVNQVLKDRETKKGI